MGQFFLVLLFIITLMAGLFSYFSPSQKSIDPFKFAMENSGFSLVEKSNRKRMQELNVTMTQGYMKIHEQMDYLAQEQQKMLDMVDEEERMLNSVNDEIFNIAKQPEGKSNVDMLRLKALGAELQDDQRLLVAHGHALVDLNNQLKRSRQSLVDQGNLMKINNESSMLLLKQHNVLLKQQADDFLDKIKQENDDSLQHSRDLIDGQHQASQDQELINQQRIADQKQRMEDLQNR